MVKVKRARANSKKFSNGTFQLIHLEQLPLFNELMQGSKDTLMHQTLDSHQHVSRREEL